MKKKSYAQATLLFALLVFSCTKEDVSSSEDSTSFKGLDLFTHNREVYDYLQCQGFDLSKARLYDEHVTLGDFALQLDEIEAAQKKDKEDSGGRTSQYVVNTTGVVSFANVMDITYFIDPSVSPIESGAWVNAINTATQNWEDITNCRVNYQSVASAGAADLIFYSSSSTSLPACARNLPGGVYAMAEFPGSSQSGRWISINPSDVSDTQGNRETVIRHELGHTLGFRHNNAGATEPANPSSCGNSILGANLLSGTPTSDGSSVMVPSIGTTTTINFSTNDRKSAGFLYPEGITIPVLTNVYSYYKTPTTRDVQLVMSNPANRTYRYQAERLPPWGSSPVQTAEYTSTSNTFWLYNVPLGTWNFRIAGTNYARDVWFNGNSIQFTVQ